MENSMAAARAKLLAGIKLLEEARKILEESLSGAYRALESLTVTSTVMSDKFDERLLKSIDVLELTVRSANCLKANNVYYIGDLVQQTEGTLLKIKGLGRISLHEIKETVVSHDLKLGTKLSGWPPTDLQG